MKIYMSYWSGGYQKTPNDYVLGLHKLSASYAVKHYKEITLITDSKSKNLFQDAPFTNITTDLDVFDGVENRNWALGKLYAYKLLAEKEEPFLHIDYDVLLMKPIPEEFIQNDIVVQSTEVYAYDQYKLEKFYANIGEKYEFELPDKTHKAYNMGIFGGTNYEFIKKYAKSALDFSLDAKNKDVFEVMYKERTWMPATISEQYYLWLLAKKYGITVTTYLDGDDSDRISNIKLDNDAIKKGYVHIQNAKNSAIVQSRVYMKLKQLAETL